MPLVGFIGEDGKRYSFADALALCESGDDAFPMPYALLKGMVEAQQNRGDNISATSILHCLREQYFTRREDYFTRPLSLYAMFRGTLFHGLLERNPHPSARVEERHTKKVMGIDISGQFDSLTVTEESNEDGQTSYVLEDWKTTENPPKWGRPYPTHVEQLNIYRWLLDLPIERTKCRVWYFSMSEWTKTEFRDGNNKSGANDYWSDAKVERFIGERIVKLKTSLVANIPMPYYLVPEDAKWQCNYCSVKQRCADVAAQEDEARWRRESGLPPIGTPVDISPAWQQLVDGVFARMKEQPNGDEAAAGTTAKRRRQPRVAAPQSGVR